ncbi:hypothetical protein CAEBREN_15770 [Caenorhabditis brenneri]|uniref:Uncharacterized protein n=1 Tax=Caenorhabditis brenneri TaxID=135651 RepID=G0N2H3_CAEBE|nr:hypothetical protein CAEBREN_15770 [Caenorhabditis brenneri]
MSKRLILLLVFCVHLTTSAAIPGKRDTAEQKEEMTKRLNQMRVYHAKMGEIGNMHEVKYDYELEKVANSMTGNCEFKNGDYTLVNATDLSSFLEKMDLDELRKYSSSFAEAVVHPLQTKIACVELVAACPARGVDERGFCLIGPHSSPPSENDSKKGPIGSHCDHGLADNGLCKAGPKSGSNSQLNFSIFAVIAAFVMIFY